MAKKPFRVQFMHKGNIYTMVYEGGFAPMWAIYKGAQVRESRYVEGYKAWGETGLPSAAQKLFCETH